MTVVNVCGNAHAGTTVLHLMLANGPEALACGEVYARFRPWRPHHVQPRCACGADPCPVWASLAGVREEEFHRTALGLPGIEYVVDSSKRLPWVCDVNRWLAATGTPVRNVVVWKEPRDLAYSIWRRRGDVGSWRSSFLGYHRQLLDTGLAFVATCYSDLVARPAVELRALCEAVGIGYTTGRERFWRGEHHHLFGSDRVRDQLARRAPGIDAARDFPPEFLRAFNDLPEGSNVDGEVLSLAAELSACSATSSPRRPGSAR